MAVELVKQRTDKFDRLTLPTVQKRKSHRPTYLPQARILTAVGNPTMRSGMELAGFLSELLWSAPLRRFVRKERFHESLLV
jgi:hypothetical protein